MNWVTSVPALRELLTKYVARTRHLNEEQKETKQQTNQPVNS